jgi:hypothetical protein
VSILDFDGVFHWIEVYVMRDMALVFRMVNVKLEFLVQGSFARKEHCVGEEEFVMAILADSKSNWIQSRRKGSTYFQ